MFYPPPLLQILHIFLQANWLQSQNILSMISTDLLYALSFLVPLLIMPIVLPMVVLLARRKRLTDNPNARKAQNSPVAVMGGTVMILVICVTSIVLNVFYDLSALLPVFCVMVMLFIFGMLDDNIGLSWQFKLGLQFFAVLLLFFGGANLDTLNVAFGAHDYSVWLSCLATVFVGLMILNAVNFMDGIDGLASGMGVFVGLIMGYWTMRHGLIIQTLLSFTVVGVMSSFFVYNVFSERYKMYMGDSGSLVLGLLLFIISCRNSYVYNSDMYMLDRYTFSFLIALFSGMVFDMVRVVIIRAIDGKSPFEPDRSHLHHIYVDMGMCHLLATLKIILNNIAVLGVWLLTALLEMNTVVQLVIVLAAGVVFIWNPYFYLTNLRRQTSKSYVAIMKRCQRRSEVLGVFSAYVRRIIDGRRKQGISHSIK